ncbi:Transposase IS116/IS110/IS902 family protein [Methylobacterium brachiatum]|nr:Transposase IS116/IS110/IS902 family protein [Methylobacterium brachiatum]
MPELRQLTREQAACLAGLAPFDRASGTHKGVLRIGGGRASVRRALYAAALAASFHWNAALCRLYRRLLEAGKPHKTALTACARKLMTYANAVLQRGTPGSESEPVLNGCSSSAAAGQRAWAVNALWDDADTCVCLSAHRRHGHGDNQSSQ